MNYETLIGLRYLRSKKKGAFVSFTTWISIVGIAIGVMALIVVIAVMTGFQDEIRERILGINPHILIMTVSGDVRDPDKVVETVRKSADVAHAFPFMSFQAMVQSGRQLSGAAVKGVRPEDVQYMKKLIKEGSLDSLSRKGSIIIGKELAKRLGLLVGDGLTLLVPFGGVSPMGAVPETVRARVGGVFETGMYDVDNGLIIMPYRDVEDIFGPGATGIEVKLRDVYRADKAREQLLKELGPGYFGRTWIEMNRNLFSALKLEKLIMFIILALIIFVASFNIISSLVMTVMEKRKDIAIMRAMGAKWQSIMKIFMIEGVTIGIVGVFIGFMSGWIMCEIQKRFKVITLPEDVYNLSALPVKISLFDMLLVVAVTLAICFASTLYPSFKAAKIDPVETLRYE
jgi:lipoprotein-releasing system permease protein